jgi:monofunctional biosynthetic peptidoglycan transglycosylase
MLPGPRVAYNPYQNLARVMQRSDMILRLLRGKGVLSEDEYRLALAEEPNIAGLQRKVDESIAKVEVVQAPMSSAAQPQADEAPTPDGAGEEKGPDQEVGVEAPPVSHNPADRTGQEEK